MIDVSPLMVRAVTAVEPKSTAVARVNPVPEMFTLVPPDVGPSVAEMPVTRGVGANPGP